MLKRLEQLPSEWGKLTWIKNLEEFQIVWMALYHNIIGDPFIYTRKGSSQPWDEWHNPETRASNFFEDWWVIPVSQENLTKFLTCELPMRDLFLANEKIWIHRSSVDGDSTYFEMPTSELTEKQLPTEKALFDPDLMPEDEIDA